MVSLHPPTCYLADRSTRQGGHLFHRWPLEQYEDHWVRSSKAAAATKTAAAATTNNVWSWTDNYFIIIDAPLDQRSRAFLALAAGQRIINATTQSRPGYQRRLLGVGAYSSCDPLVDLL